MNLPAPRVYPNPGFRNIVIPRLGVEYRAFDRGRFAIDVRGGYGYEPSPVPHQIGESNFADTDKHTFSVGGTLEVKYASNVILHPWSFDLNFGATYLPLRIERKIDPVDRVGDYRASGSVFHFGIGLRSRF